MSVLNHEAPTIFQNIWYPLSKLGVTVEVRSFDGACKKIHRLRSFELCCSQSSYFIYTSEAEFKDKHGVWDPIPWLSTLFRLQDRLQHIYHGIGQPYAKVDLNPTCQGRLYPPVRDLGFGLWYISRESAVVGSIPNLSCRQSLYWHQRGERLREREKRNAVTIVILADVG
jgi:hypothetical protein